jgi:hypothetical protein
MVVNDRSRIRFVAVVRGSREGEAGVSSGC